MRLDFSEFFMWSAIQFPCLGNPVGLCLKLFEVFLKNAWRQGSQNLILLNVALNITAYWMGSVYNLF